MMKKEIKRVKLTEIDFSDRSFCYIDPETNFNELFSAIKSTGIINPPLLQKQVNKYRIVTGFKRLEIAKLMDIKDLYSWLADPDCKASDLFEFSLKENLSQRELNIFEKVRAIICLENIGVSENEIVDLFMPMLGLNPSIHLKDELLFIDKIPKALQKYIERKKLPWRRFQHLDKMSQSELNYLAKLIIILNPSATVFEELSRDLLEVARREGLLLNQVAMHLGLDNMIDEAGLSDRERMTKIRRAVNIKRYPTLAGINQEIEDKLSNLEKLDFLKIDWDKKLEDTGLTFEFKINNANQLEEVMDFFSNEKNKTNIKLLWELIEKYEL